MSQSEGSSTCRSRVDEKQSHIQQEKYSNVWDPKVDLQEADTTFLSTSLALQCLEELFLLDKISGDKMAKLKVSLRLLHDTLQSSQESELKLLQEVKSFHAELKVQQQELSKIELCKDDQHMDSHYIGQQLLQFQNKLREAEEGEQQIQYKLSCVQEEKIYLKNEYEKQPKSVVKRSMALKEACEKMKIENTQRHQDIRTLKVNIKACNTQLQMEQQELEHRKEMIKNKETELVQLLSIPGKMWKETETVICKTKHVQKQKAVLERELLELGENMKQTEMGCWQLDEECRNVIKELKGCRAQLEVAQRERGMLLKELEMTKEKEAIVLEQRALLGINLNHIMEKRNTLNHSLVKKVREKDWLRRSLKNMLRQHKSSKDSLLCIQELYNKMKTQMDISKKEHYDKMDIMPKDDDLLRKIQDLQTEVNKLKLKVVTQQLVKGVEVQLAEQYTGWKHVLIRECSQHHEELHHLHALTRIKADERDQKSRELRRAQMKCRQIEQNIQEKQLQILEHKKQFHEIQSRICVFAKLFDTTKGERNKFANLLQVATQRKTKMREKFTILKNEIEILQGEKVKKDRLLQKSRLKHLHIQIIRDSLRNDISKVKWMLNEMQHKTEEQKLKIIKLGQVINAQEQDLLQMHKSHNSSFQSHSERGVQLLNREEEMYVFYAKINVQESMICEGTLQVQALEEEICSLEMRIREEQRQINLSNKQVFYKRHLKDECALLKIQLSECKEHNLSLEKTLEDQVTMRRLRKLSGVDPSPPELIKDIEQLEVQLAATEAKLLEKELIYDRVTRLSREIHTNADKDTLKLAKKVNEFQNRIKDSNKKLMSVVSELAMRQTQALCLQHELQEKLFELDLCQRRLEKGLVPSDTIEYEWLQQIRAQGEHQMSEEEEWSQLPNGVYTTAKLRPNFYISAEVSLPLPKPYGALAPFKPSEPGTNMRHIRKPQSKLLEF